VRLKLPLVLLVAGVGLLTLALLRRAALAPEAAPGPGWAPLPWLLLLGSAGVLLGLLGLARVRLSPG